MNRKMQILLAYGLCFGAAALVGGISYPPLVERVSAYMRRNATTASVQLEDMFLVTSPRTLWLAYGLAPLAGGAIAWLLTGQWFMGCLGAGVGMLVPKLALAHARSLRRKRFHAQLVDSLLLLSSSLKAGMSMTQAFSVVTEEMPPPISQEFGLMLKETRMGLSLEEAMAHLKQRMPSDDLNLFVTAVLVARETGGDLTRLFGRLVETLRDRKKLQERIKTLTFMARMQGMIMAMLPFLFAAVVYQMNSQYFQFFFTNPTGRFMLMLIVMLQGLGGLLFFRFSRSPL